MSASVPVSGSGSDQRAAVCVGGSRDGRAKRGGGGAGCPSRSPCGVSATGERGARGVGGVGCPTRSPPRGERDGPAIRLLACRPTNPLPPSLTRPATRVPALRVAGVIFLVAAVRLRCVLCASVWTRYAMDLSR